MALKVDDAVGLLVGLRATGGTSGGISAVRITDIASGTTYEVIEPWTLRLTFAAASPSPE